MSVCGEGRGSLVSSGEGPAVQPGDVKPDASTSSDPSPTVLTARVTEILDVTSFWAQIGTESHLAEFDQQCSLLSAWCEEHTGAAEEGAGGETLPKVNDVVMVRGRDQPGRWVRAKVTRQLSDSEVQVFFIDLGTSLCVPLSDVCHATPPMMCHSPKQALDCTLHGVSLIEGVNPDDALSLFLSLSKSPCGLKAVVHSINEPESYDVSLYTLTSENQWTSIGHILHSRNLAKWDQMGPVMVLEANALKDDDCHDDAPSDSHTATPTNLHSEATPLTPVGSPPPCECATPQPVEPVTQTCSASEKPATAVEQPKQVEEGKTQAPNKKVSGESCLDKLSSVDTDSVSSGDDDEWDESLLPGSSNTQSCSSDASGSTPLASPSKQNQASTNREATRAHLKNQFEKLVMSNLGKSQYDNGGVDTRKKPFQRKQHYDNHGWKRGGQWDRCGRGRGSNNNTSSRLDSHYPSNSDPPVDFDKRYPLGGTRGWSQSAGRGGGALQEKFGSTRREFEEPHPPLVSHPPPSSHPPPASQPHKGFGMTSSEAKNEAEWLTWKIQNKTQPILASLSADNTREFAGQVQDILADHSAEKLSYMLGDLAPISVVLECLIAFAVEAKPSTDLAVFVTAMEAVYGSIGSFVSRSLLSVLEKLAGDVMSHTGSQKAFCLFLGELFLSACCSGLQDYCTAVGKVVRHFLNVWSHCENERQLMGVAHAECLAALCECVGPTLDNSNRETLDEYFNGAIKENILSSHLSRQIKEVLFEVYMKRVGHWGQAPPLAPPTSDTPVPQFSKEAPPPVGNIIQPVAAAVRYDGHGSRNETIPPQPVSIPYQSNSQSAFVQVSPVQPVIPVQQAEATPTRPYAEVERMLQSLECEELLYKFKSAMIRDNVLSYDSEVVRAALKEASIPAGAVLSIMGYLANKKRPLTNSSHHSVVSPSTPLSHQGSTPSSPYRQTFNYPPPTVLPYQIPPRTHNHQSPGGNYHHNPQSPAATYQQQAASAPTYQPQSSYPPQSPQSSYPPQSPAASYPPQSPAASYPPQSPAASYPPQSPAASYPPQSPAASYPPQSPAASYPPGGGVFPPSYAVNGAQHYQPPPAGIQPSFPPPLTNQPLTQQASQSVASGTSERHVVYSLPRDNPKPVGVALPGSASVKSCDPPGERKGGFGMYRCIICRTSDHSTDMCPDRREKFFLH